MGDREHSLAVYQRLSDRYQSHITIMWQAPALGLAAEAFLLTVTLEPSATKTARILSALLGALVALMSMQLMAKHRYISRRDEGALRLLENQLGIASPWEGVEVKGSPWSAQISSYVLWQCGLALFAVANVAVLVLLVFTTTI